MLCCFIKITLINENAKLEDRALGPLYIDMDEGLPGKSRLRYETQKCAHPVYHTQ